MFEKTKEFFDSMTLDELTEFLKSIGIEFVDNPDYMEGEFFESED